MREQYNYSKSGVESKRIMQDLWAVIAQSQLRQHKATELGVRNQPDQGPAERIRILRKAGHLFKRDENQHDTFVMPTPAGMLETARTLHRT